jgi:hypothetical protein
MEEQLEEFDNGLKPEKVLNILPGKSLDIQVNHPVLTRIKVTLVGYEAGKYILLKYPNSKAGSFKDVLVEGNVLIVRYLLEGDKGECVAFRSSIKHIIQYPERFLVIEYPKRVENRQLRLHQRVLTHLPAEIALPNDNLENDAKLSGLIVDISQQGCRFVFKSDNEKVNVKKTDIHVYINTPGQLEPTCINAEVCNSRFENGRVYVGIKFIEHNGNVSQLMESLFIDPDIIG